MCRCACVLSSYYCVLTRTTPVQSSSGVGDVRLCCKAASVSLNESLFPSGFTMKNFEI